MNETSSTQELISPARVVRERMGFHLRQARLLGKLLRVAETIEREQIADRKAQAERQAIPS
ncbi:hypothetical protein [Paludisphaera rhizosphaerae]|uniref:hypothetical protein n=1 Tax=Paludisphaera rhizosphaerae TaxID=2711216 RepID=UPI0013EB493C|nr:hypothetical protein [Paludisphaera rhizosphaerae]